ncbi:MAG: hypothetical protein IJK67_05750 [Bacilli bacterium]|nr:hypothetical protein [Bacilli bacterium]
MINKSIKSNELHYRKNDEEFDIIKIKKFNVIINRQKRHLTKLLLKQMRDVFNNELDTMHLILNQK